MPSSQRALAQYVLHLSRMKLDQETSASEPRLLRVLVCAVMADKCVIEGQLTWHEEGQQQPNFLPPERRRDGWQSRLAATRGSTSRSKCSVATTTTSSSQPIHSYPHPHSKPPQSLQPPTQPFTRPQAFLCDRTIFRKSIAAEIHQQQQQHVDSIVESDSDSADSDPTYSDDDEFYIDDETSDCSSEDGTERERQTRQMFAAPDHYCGPKLDKGRTTSERRFSA